VTWLHYLGVALVVGVLVAVGIAAGRAVKSSADFTGGARKAGVAMVTGALTGTIIGGASTIGTAQLAYTNGLSAWWFTIGAGLGMVAMFFMAPKFYRSGHTTIPQIVSAEFGQRAGSLMAVLASAGIFLSVVAQVLSGVALISAVAPVLPAIASLLLVLALIIVYVFFGGLLSAGRAGIWKTVCIVATVAVCGILGLSLSGGFPGLLGNPALPHGVYFDLFGRGYGIEVGGCLSLLLGVACEQAYLQALLSARTLPISRASAGLAAILMPTVGGLGILVGLSMRLTHPGLESALALPQFILDYIPALPAGMMLGALLLVVVGSSAGLTFGISTVLVKDLLLPARKRFLARDSRINLPTWTRVVLVGVLGLAAVVALTDIGGLIMDWSFLALGLRACVACFPLLAALYFPGRVNRRFAIAAMVAGPVGTALGAWLLPPWIDPILLGIAGALAAMLAGWRSPQGKGGKSRSEAL
jgi:SSS family solute:Na+ symporter